MLLSKDQLSKIPKLYATEHDPLEDKVAFIKLFHPLSNWTWYIIESDGDDLCWGLVSGHETEFGYFSLKELSQTSALGLPIERDVLFRPTRVTDLAVFNRDGVVF